MLGELTATTTDYKAVSRDTTGNKTASSPIIERKKATIVDPKPTKVKPFHLPEEPEVLSRPTCPKHLRR